MNYENIDCIDCGTEFCPSIMIILKIGSVW